jgi:hypothetical protein
VLVLAFADEPPPLHAAVSLATLDLPRLECTATTTASMSREASGFATCVCRAPTRRVEPRRLPGVARRRRAAYTRPGLFDAGCRTAIEVELHQKARPRVRAILRRHRELVRAGRLDRVSYVTNRRDVAAVVRGEGEAALLGTALTVGPLQAVIARTREIAAERRQSSE